MFASSQYNNNKDAITTLLAAELYRPEKFGEVMFQLMQQLSTHYFLASHLRQFSSDK